VDWPAGALSRLEPTFAFRRDFIRVYSKLITQKFDFSEKSNFVAPAACPQLELHPNVPDALRFGSTLRSDGSPRRTFFAIMALHP
jgi:hypothetical protein